MKEGLVYKSESYNIMGACFKVYRNMGRGFLEPVYQECLEIEFKNKGIPYTSQNELELKYQGIILKQKYKPDFTCYGKIIVEIKAVEKIADEHRSQILNYLNATGYKLGLLVNFGRHPRIEYERFVL